MSNPALTPPIQSPNFGFLAAHDQLLVSLAARAERYVFDDPIVCLLKLRQLAERIAHDAAENAGIEIGHLPQVDVIRRLVDRRIVPPNVANFFHTIRTNGNVAAHEFEGSQTLLDALTLLQLARQIAVWFHRTFKDQKFKPGPFRPPPAPKDLKKETKALTEELERLRHQLAVQTDSGEVGARVFGDRSWVAAGSRCEGCGCLRRVEGRPRSRGGE